MTDCNSYSPPPSELVNKRIGDLRAYKCCHEAGHTVIRVLIGDTVVAVQCPGMGGGPFTGFKLREMRCECGGYVRNLTPDECKKWNGVCDLFSDIGKPNPDCPECRRYLIEHVAASLAGGVATKSLSPVMHLSEDSLDDCLQCDCLVESFAVPVACRTSVKDEARVLAERLISREEKAVRALAGELVRASGELDGPQACQIVKNHLARSDLQL